MGSTLRTSADAPERPSLAEVCGKSIKAELHPHLAAPRVRDVAAASVEHTTTHKGAASDIGIDRSRFSHKLKDGSLNLAQLEELGVAFAAEFGRQLLEVYGPLSTPQQRVRDAIREIRRKCDEVEQFLEFIA